MSFTRAWNAPNCWRRAMLRRTHNLFRFFSFSFSSSSLMCCSTANAPSKIAYSSSLLLLQLSAIAVKKHVCVYNGLHLMTSFTQFSRLDCLATTTCDMFSYECLVRGTRTSTSYEALVRVTPPLQTNTRKSEMHMKGLIGNGTESLPYKNKTGKNA